MNILFYLDPSIEFNNPSFRYTSFRNSILPQAKALHEAGHKISIIVNSVIAKIAETECLTPNGIDLVIVDIFDITNMSSFSTIAIDNDKEKQDLICSILRKAWKNRNQPDIIIVWESVTPYLLKIFKKAKIIFQTPGFFSRPPYPQLISLNSGLLESTTSPEAYSWDTAIDFNKIRSELREFFAKTSSIFHKLTKLKQTYEKIILFPLQVDGYFMVDSQIKGRKQINLIYEILESLPGNIALIVTDYRSKDINSNVVNKHNESILKEKYHNFIYDEEINNTFCVSQQLLPLVDGVITISSSVGLQAAFWELPLFVYGNNYVSKFKTAGSIAELLQQLRHKINQDVRVYKSIIYQNISIPGKSCSNEQWVNDFFSYLNCRPNSLSKDSKWLENNLRKKEYLRAIKYDASKFIDRENCQELVAQIRKHKIISFDIFDTLLMRPFLCPSDLFKFIEPKVRDIINDYTFDFVTKRRIAEKVAFENALSRGDGEITIEEIYDRLCSENGIPNEKASLLISLEITTEENTLYRRESIYNGYILALSLNKTIIITSDMYLPKAVIEGILCKNKIEYDKLYLSSEIKKKKSTGELFDYILSDIKCKPEEILHIGDNVKGDLRLPKSKGIHCFHMPRTIEKMLSDETGFYKNIWKRDERNHSLSAKVILALLGNYYYDNSYLPLRKNTIFNGNIKNLGYMGFGPLLFGYIKWLCEHGIRKGITDFYFLARDGKIMEEAYDIIARYYPKAPRSHYMLCSRRSVNLCKIKDFSGINDLLHVEFASNIQLGDLIKNRFGINPSHVPEEVFTRFEFSPSSKISNSDVERLIPFFKCIQPIIIAGAQKERKSYLKYLNQIGFESKNDTIGIVDIGYAGTMQQSLYEIAGVRSLGFYLITFRKAIERLQNSGLKSYGYLGNFIDRHDTCEPFCRFVPLFETLFSSSDTSFVKFIEINNELLPIFQEPCLSESKRKQIVEQIHEGSLNFIKTASNVFKSDLRYLDIEPFKSERMLISYFSNPDPRDAKLLQGVIFEDAYGGKSEKIILPDDINYKGDVVWKIGLNALNQVKISKTINTNQKLSLDSSKVHSTLGKKIILKIYKSVLSAPRYQKLESRPEEFFRDSKNFFTKKIASKIYFMSY